MSKLSFIRVDLVDCDLSPVYGTANGERYVGLTSKAHVNELFVDVSVRIVDVPQLAAALEAAERWRKGLTDEPPEQRKKRWWQ